MNNITYSNLRVILCSWYEPALSALYIIYGPVIQWSHPACNGQLPAAPEARRRSSSAKHHKNEKMWNEWVLPG